jgi:lysophospholipase L1-like esterase
VARRLEFEVVSFACSGARVADLVTDDASRDESERRTAQVTRLAGAPDATLVLVTVGGNDVGFAKILRACTAQAHCQNRQGTGGDSPAARIDDLAMRLPDVYRRIKQAAPGARVVVVGYPRLFPARPGANTCAALDLIGPDEVPFLNALTDRLNGAISAAASQAGAGYVDVSDRFRGHEVSCRGEQWINHLRLVTCRTCSFHPNLLGQRALAVGVAPAVGGNPYPLLRIGGIGTSDFGATFSQLESTLGAKLECWIKDQRPCFCYRAPLHDGEVVGPFIAGDSLNREKARFDAYYDASPDGLTDHMIRPRDPVRLLKSAYGDLRRLGRAHFGTKWYVVSDKDGSVQFVTSRGRIFAIAGGRDRHPYRVTEFCT